MSDSCSPRKLEAGFDGIYLMSSVLMTSTMKSEPATPPMRGNSFGGAVSAAATCMVGGSADGARDRAEALDEEVAAVPCGDATAVAAPVTAAAARNPRRLTLERACFGVLLSRAMWLSPCSQGAAIVLLRHRGIEGYYRCRWHAGRRPSGDFL